MNREQKLEKELEEIKKLAKQDAGIDAAALAAAALQNENEKRLVSARTKKWAYLISLALPPLGLFFAFKLYFNEEEDARRVAVVCVVLTAASIVLAFFILQMLIASSGLTLDQLEQAPQEYRQLLQ